MFRVALGLLVVAIIAAVFGFGGIAGTATELAKIVFVVALVLAVISFLMGGRGSTALAFVLALSLPALARSATITSSHASSSSLATSAHHVSALV